ncbi:unnamed protein product [Candidula unifasciata]|uniref:Globin n=1 Tax=Candidula unifasciata TaxID=100452 RepID=A0A8S3Z4M1_9EUPU|nr:unnamed protein product [Candidula unifasciata]
MGCELTKNNVVVPEMPEEDVTVFSDTQIDTIRSTWPLLSRDGVRVGVEVFMRIFRETPSIRRLFESLGSKDIDNLQHYPVFQDHALKFMKVLESLVQNMEDPEVIQPHLVALGVRHAAIDGYHPEYFRVYSKCLLEVWEMELGEEFISEVKECWKHVIKYIVRYMVHGYDMCLTDQLENVMTDCNFEKLDYT